MDAGMTCEHLNQLTDHLEDPLWHSKEDLACFDCGCPGPNLWICLQPECHHVGCSEVKNDHSTIHQKSQPLHCVHMNISTERIWCYICEREVHIKAALAHRSLPTSTSLSSSLHHYGVDKSFGSHMDGDDENDDSDYDDDETRPRGLVGLQNMGNTCYMNAALQALSHTPPLTAYFLDCAPALALRVQDKKTAITKSYQKLIREMWNKKTRGYVVPSGILYGIRNVHPMFRGYHQHDTQEFLRCFMDQLHEELKEPIYDSSPDDKVTSDSEMEHDARSVHVRRRAASSGANDAPVFARMRRKSPASFSESRDGYLRVCPERPGGKHRRSASFAGTHQVHYALTNHHLNNCTPVESASAVSGASSSSSSLSGSSSERFETCSSNSDQPDTNNEQPTVGTAGGDGGAPRYRSVVSDVFDGTLLSTVQCLVCHRVSTRVETFQDLSLPIPSRDHLAMLRTQQQTHTQNSQQDSWLWWVVGWLRSWVYGPVVSLQDCLAAFFSADELKGDNMYSCSRCNKLRNGVKMSGVLRLPEVLCVHLKRFRHELMYSSKLAARVSFPLDRLDMQPYMHKECTSTVSTYSLCAVICHSGGAGGGHYTCVARGPRGWHHFDDHTVSRVTSNDVAHAEAYVLFYRKVNPAMTRLRQEAAEILESTTVEPNDIKFYISKQWINKFSTWAEPGPIDNSDFVCRHGGVRPDRAADLPHLAAVVTQPLWEYLYNHFGGGPACTHIAACVTCARLNDRLAARRQRELEHFYTLNQIFQEQEHPRAIYAISMNWFRQWQAFVRNKTQSPPPPIDNTGILTKQEINGITSYILKPGSDHAQLSEELWRFFTDLYGGGPEVRLRGPTPVPTLTRKYSQSDHEEYCNKSASEINVRDYGQGEAVHKNQSLQNLNRARPKQSDEKVETNGNYDSDVDMDSGIVNGLDHDTNDNPVFKKYNDVELLNLDSISLRAIKNGKRKSKRRTVK